MKRNLLLTLTLLTLSAVTLSAQESKSIEKDFSYGWYIGAQGALSIGEGDFSSFGADKFRAGGNGGLFGGYRFDRVWSLELNAHWGGLNMAEQECCLGRDYWIAPTTWERFRLDYFPKTAEGVFYKDLLSRTFVQQYSLQANMNLLGLFDATRESRWMLELSPMVSAVGTSSDILTKQGGNPVRENISQWHLGVGGAMQVSYAVTEQLTVGVYGDFTHLFNDPLDGMPELHSTNFMVDAGVRLSWNFGKRKGENEKRKTGSVPAVVAPTEQRTEERAEITEVVANEVKTENEKVKTETELKAENENVKTEDEDFSFQISDFTSNEDFSFQISDFTFPVVYFSFNSVWIEPSERAKVKEIADLMKANPEMRVCITGWGDEVGGEEANKRVSLQRAEAVKRVLGQWLIPAERVETVGGGIAHDAPSREEARHAATIEVKTER